MIKLKSLFYFKTIVEQGSLSASAARLYIAQPALSKALQQLEQDWHVQLFERSRKGMVTTQAGNYLYQKACHLLNEAAKLDYDMKLYGEGQRGLIRMGSVSMGLPYLTALIKHYSHIAFSLVQGDTYLLEEQLNSQQIDLALVHLPLTLLNKGISVTPLQHSSFKVLCHQDMKLADKDSVTLKELANEPLALLRRRTGYGIYDNVVQCFAKQAITPNIQYDANDVPMLVNLAQHKLAVALMPMLGQSIWPNLVALSVPELDKAADELALVYLTQSHQGALRQIIHWLTSDGALIQEPEA